jgi:hypothetical protein
MLGDSTLRDERFGENTQFSRRQLLGTLAGAGLVAAGIGSLAGCGAPQSIPQGGTDQKQASPQPVSPQPASGQSVAAPPPEGVLGVNINSASGVMSFPELQNVKATWVRGFFIMSDAAKGNPANHEPIQALLTVASRGYGTILSLMFQYDQQPIPTPGTPAMAEAQRYLDAVLPTVMNKVDILVIGNEPFIDCTDKDRNSDQLNVFYETMAQRAIDYRSKQFGSGSKTQLYMGALNRLYLQDWRTAATERWMQFVRTTSSISGTDIHPHLPAPGDGSYFLNYILPRMRPDQKFLATEFSLAMFYQKHLTDAISADFANRYHMQPGTPVWQVIKSALSHPFTQQKWDDFLSMSPWFADNKNFMRDEMDSLRATGKLAVAAYGLGQGPAMSKDNFGPNTVPWLLNSMFCQHTVQPARNGLPGQNTVWTSEFRSLQSQQQ